jgi:hypothetical protein
MIKPGKDLNIRSIGESIKIDYGSWIANLNWNVIDILYNFYRLSIAFNLIQYSTEYLRIKYPTLYEYDLEDD